jgi:hypothetical protein
MSLYYVIVKGNAKDKMIDEPIFREECKAESILIGIYDYHFQTAG